MENNIRFVALIDLVHAEVITYRSNKCDKIQTVAVFLNKLLLYLISIVLIDINDYHLFRLILGDLPNKLRADRSASACYHAYLVMNKFLDVLIVEFNRVTPKKLLSLYVANLSEKSSVFP